MPDARPRPYWPRSGSTGRTCSRPAATARPRWVDTYDYTDEQGRLLYQAVRYFPKGFRRRRPDGHGGWLWKIGDTRLVLYGLPRVLAAIEAGQPVYVVEGEKDVHAIERAGAAATTIIGGVSGRWLPEFSRLLAKPESTEPEFVTGGCGGAGRRRLGCGLPASWGGRGRLVGGDREAAASSPAAVEQAHADPNGSGVVR